MELPNLISSNIKLQPDLALMAKCNDRQYIQICGITKVYDVVTLMLNGSFCNYSTLQRFTPHGPHLFIFTYIHVSLPSLPSLPDLHELNKKYSEMLKWRKELMHKLDISNDFYKILRTTSIRRNSLLPYLKDMIAHRVAKTFKSELEMRGYTGKLNIDIDERTIEMIVRISRSTQGETNTRSLSGGERSYTTICFLLALWKVAQVPFRILDEFDVFMVRFVLFCVQ
jgi:hypothetical protein